MKQYDVQEFLACEFLVARRIQAQTNQQVLDSNINYYQLTPYPLETLIASMFWR